MIELMFVAGWTLLFLFAGWLGPVRWHSRFRVYVLISMSCIYLCGLFILFPVIRRSLGLP